jgi:hypothetical protein
MALVVKDRVKETTTTTGTGTVTLAGAVTGYQSFSAIGNANTTYYTISSPGVNEWEVGIGTYTSSGTTLSRDTILASSNSGSAVNFSAGTKDVFVVYPAGKAIYLDASGNSVALGTPASTTTLTNCTGLPISTGVNGLGTNVATALAVNTGSAGAFVVNGGALGTPSSGTLSSCSGLPISTGVNGLGTGVATFLATPSSANLASAMTDETGSGLLVFGTSPTMSNITLSAGTASLAPVAMTSGTNLTSPVAGTIEYDGTNYYLTPTTGTTELRGIIPSTQQFVLSSNGSAFGAALGNFFGSNSAIQLAATTTYFIEAYCYFLKTTAGTATWAALFSSAPTVAHATLEYTPVTGFTTSIITGAMVVAEATANAVANMAFGATASLTTAVYHVAKFRVFVTTNAAANLRFNLTQSAGTATPQAGSWYTVRKVATNAGNYVA